MKVIIYLLTNFQMCVALMLSGMPINLGASNGLPSEDELLSHLGYRTEVHGEVLVEYYHDSVYSFEVLKPDDKRILNPQQK